MTPESSPELVLGPAGGDQMWVRPGTRSYAGGLAVFDHNWLSTEVIAKTAARSWKFHAFLRTDDFAQFHRGLTELCAGQQQLARFNPEDPWLTVAVHTASSTGFRVEVRARQEGSEKAIAYAYELDRPGLERLTEDVRTVVDRFPVVS